MSTRPPTNDQSLRTAPSVGGEKSEGRPQPYGRQNLVTWADKAVMDGLLWRGRRLDGRDFQGANLRGSTFDDCSLTACDFSDADLRGARFINCDMRRANLDRASLADATFSGTWLTGCHGLTALDRARIRGAGGRFLLLIQDGQSEPKAA